MALPSSTTCLCARQSFPVLWSALQSWLAPSASGSLPYSGGYQGELNVCQQINNLPALDGFSLFVLSFTFGITRQPWRVGRWTHLKMSSIKMNRNMMAPLLALKLFSKFLMQAALLIAALSGDHFTLSTLLLLQILIPKDTRNQA